MGEGGGGREVIFWGYRHDGGYTTYLLKVNDVKRERKT